MKIMKNVMMMEVKMKKMIIKIMKTMMKMIKNHENSLKICAKSSFCFIKN